MAAAWGHSDKVLALILAERAECTDESAQEVSVTLLGSLSANTPLIPLTISPLDSPNWRMDIQRGGKNETLL